MSKGENSISFATDRANVSKFKIVFIGDQGVGKSSIISSFIKNQFDATHNPTVGIDFVSKNLNIKGKTVRLQLWDTAGQERFRSLIPSYLKDCNAAFIVYDITNQGSFESIPKWLDFVKEYRGNDTIVYILGNKTDLQSQRTVQKEKIEQLTKAENIPYTEVSAKTGSNLNQIFRNLCSKLLNSPLEETDINQSVVKGLKASNIGQNIGSSIVNSNIGIQSKPIANKQDKGPKANTVLRNESRQEAQRIRSSCC